MAVLNPVDTVRAALRELLDSARENIERGEGPRGFPAALALFSIIDTIGSYFRGNPDFTITIEGEQHPIRARRARDHIRILNSKFFSLKLTMAQLKELYALARSPVTHNATIGYGLWLTADPSATEPIEKRPDGMHIHLPALFKVCEAAVRAFDAVAAEVIPNSLAFKELQEKATPNETYDEQVERLAKEFKDWGPGLSIPVTGVDSGRRRP